MVSGQKIEIENVTSPGRVTRVDADKYEAMRQTLAKVLPATSPGLSAAEMLEGVVAIYLRICSRKARRRAGG